MIEMIAVMPLRMTALLTAACGDAPNPIIVKPETAINDDHDGGAHAHLSGLDAVNHCYVVRRPQAREHADEDDAQDAGEKPQRRDSGAEELRAIELRRRFQRLTAPVPDR